MGLWPGIQGGSPSFLLFFFGLETALKNSAFNVFHAFGYPPSYRRQMLIPAGNKYKRGGKTTEKEVVQGGISNTLFRAAITNGESRSYRKTKSRVVPFGSDVPRKNFAGTEMLFKPWKRAWTRKASINAGLRHGSDIRRLAYRNRQGDVSRSIGLLVCRA